MQSEKRQESFVGVGSHQNTTFGVLVIALSLLCGAHARADDCFTTNPADGLRACDFLDPFTTMNCTLSRDDETPVYLPVGADYSSYPEGVVYLQNLAAEYYDVMLLADMPDALEIVEEDGDSLNKRSFPVVKITAGVENSPYEERPDIVFVCDMHVREWADSEVCMALIDYLVKHASDEDISELLNAVEVWVLPFSNPGGRRYDESTDAGYNFGNPWDASRHWRKNRYWVEDCETEWIFKVHTGNCDEVEGNNRWGNGTNTDRNFSFDWEQSTAVDKNDVDRSEIFPTYVTAQGKAIKVAPELINCGGNPDLCPIDHPNCVLYDQDATVFPPLDFYGCFMYPSFSDPITALADCEEHIGEWDTHGIIHQACQELPVAPGTFVLTECGLSGLGNFFNSTLLPAVIAPSGLAALGYCEGSVYVMCRDDISCDDLQSEGLFDEVNDLLKPGADLMCSPDGYCGYDSLRTCCANDYHGAEQFESPESRIIRHLVLNSQIVALVDIHNFGAWFSDTYKRTLAGFTAGGALDRTNLDIIRNSAAFLADQAAGVEWNFRSGSGTGDPTPDFFTTINLTNYGTVAGQLPGWAACTPTGVGGALSNFDNNTYRGINAFNIELPPWNYDDMATHSTAEKVDWAKHMSCDSSTFPDTEDGFKPRSRMAVQVVSAWFIAAARYLIEQTTTPLVGTDASGAPNATRAETGITGLLVHDGSGKGVIHGEIDNTVYVPAGRWAISGDVVYQNTNPSILPIPTNYTVLLEKSELSGIGYLLTQSRSLDSNTVYGPLYSGEFARYSARFEFKPGMTYQVSAELSAATHDDTRVNDVRLTKVQGLGCATGPLPDSTEHPGAMTSDEFCADRVESDEDRFFCNEDKDRCQECGINPTDYGSEVAPPCSTWYGAGSFCTDGMCDTPDVCWSAAYEDDFEGVGSRDIQGSFNTTTRWNSTMHQDNGNQDTDRIRYWYTVPYEAIGGKTLELFVAALCTADGTAIGDDVLEYRAFVGMSDIVPLGSPDMILIDWTAVTQIDWTAPTPFVDVPITLTNEQAQAVFNGAPITVVVRSIADSLGNYPSVVYGVSMGILGGGELPDFSKEWEKLIVQPWEPVTLAPSGESSSTATIVPDSGRVAAGDTLVFKVDGAPGSAARSAQVVVTDATGESVGRVVRTDTAILVPLSSLDPLDGPFEMHVQSTTDPLSGTVYHCPANTPDCLQFDPSRDACGGDTCDNGAVCCRGANEYAECTNLSGDPDNCGACGWPCGPNETCLDGVCAVVTSFDCDGTTCPGNLACCEDPNGLPSCLERKTDPDNCGWCGHTCAANKRCQLGLCVPRWGEKCSATCTGGKSCCYTVLGGNQCVNMASSQINCGKCGNVCGFDQTCSEGICVPWLSVYDPCWGGRTNCGAPEWIDCRDLNIDVENCGYCGVRCAEEAECVDGQCVKEESLPPEPEHD